MLLYAKNLVASFTSGNQPFFRELCQFFLLRVLLNSLKGQAA